MTRFLLRIKNDALIFDLYRAIERFGRLMRCVIYIGIFVPLDRAKFHLGSALASAAASIFGQVIYTAIFVPPD